eukprot:11929728-Alexandrium_andersonii.AAC.1
MSASLVGSEMCIRDSCCSVRAGRWHSHANYGRQRARRTAVTACSIGVWAVSYTHLTLPTICSV